MKTQKKSKTMKGGDLIGSGGFGCVFRPALPCKNRTKKKNKISKIFTGKNSKREAIDELKNNMKIKKIKGYKKWGIIWSTGCKTAKYKRLYKHDKDIMKCLKDEKITISDFNKYSYMLLGEYGGSTITDVLKKEFKDSFKTKEAFVTSLIKVFKQLEPLFLGLKEMYKNKIIHMDITRKNIVYNHRGFRYIDFGLTCSYDETLKIKKRSVSELLDDRIYIAYPYDFLFMYANNKDFTYETEDMEKKDYREYYDEYTKIHSVFFDRDNHSKLLSFVRNHKKEYSISEKKRNSILGSIDVYSMGILIPRLILRFKPDSFSDSALKEYLEDERIKNIILLFRFMTREDYTDEGPKYNPIVIYNRYMKLKKSLS